MAIELICPGCAKKLRVGEEHAGKSARCPACGTVTPVTSAAALHSRPDATPDSTPASPFSALQDSTPAVSSTPVGGAQPGGFPSSSSQAGGAATLGGAKFGATTFGGASASSVVGGAGSSSGGQTATDGRWLLRADNGQTYGPIPRAELDAWVQQGRVSATSYVIREGDAQWLLASDVYPQLKPMTTSASGNPWADAPTPGGFAYPPPSGGYGYGPTGAYGGYKRPHRGVMVLVLGALSWVVCCVFGPVAFFLGQADVSAMKRGEMDDSGLGMTRAGMYLGLAHLVLMIVAFGFAFIAAIMEEM
ncbi:MAG: GYF domain-containing protein [Pirellulales bacterium]